MMKSFKKYITEGFEPKSAYHVTCTFNLKNIIASGGMIPRSVRKQDNRNYHNEISKFSRGRNHFTDLNYLHIWAINLHSEKPDEPQSFLRIQKNKIKKYELKNTYYSMAHRSEYIAGISKRFYDKKLEVDMFTSKKVSINDLEVFNFLHSRWEKLSRSTLKDIENYSKDSQDIKYSDVTDY